MSTADATGLTMDTYSDLLEQFIALAVAWKGASISTDEKELLGHLIRGESYMLAEVNEIIQAVYDSQSVSAATGTRLTNLLELVKIERQDDAPSTATVTLTVSKATTIPAGSVARTVTNVKFETDANVVFVGAGSDDVTATCTENGANNAAIGEINTIVTAVTGWTGVTNAAAAIPGRLRENDAELKTSHTLAVATSGERDAASIYEVVDAVDGVSGVRVDEDYTSSTPVSVYVIGGTNAAVAAAIDGQLTIGIGTAGTTSVDVWNVKLAQLKTINFTRATDLDTYIDMTLTVNSTLFPEDGELQIRNALIALYAETYQRIGADVIYLSLPGAILSVPGIVISELYLDDTASPVVAVDLVVASDKRAVIESANITIGYTA